MRFLVILLLFLFASITTKAEESFKTVRVETQGEGITPKRAIEDALIEAIKRVYGVNIEGISQVSFSYKERNKDEDSYFEQKNELERRLHEKFKGFIESYTVEDLTYDKKDGLYYAKVFVVVKKYVAPGLSPDSRRKLAIYPFRLEDTNLLFPKNRIEELFNQALTTVITH
jgi:ribosomal protein S12 methylthiotransferase accessory factor YcaO